DVLFGKPISVTHCDLQNCTRVFTGAESAKPLALACGGMFKGGLLLSAPGGIYVQETGASFNPDSPDLNLEQIPFVVTTCADWKRDHPQTAVYDGDNGEVPGFSRSPRAQHTADELMSEPRAGN